MFLKLRVPFFADFDKKTLRPVMERMLCNFYKKHQIVARLGDNAECLMIVLDGELGAYEGIGHEDITKDLIPTTTIATLGTWGETGMTEDETWMHTVKATKKSLVLSLLKKDLIEVLSHVKGIEQRNKQSFLLKSQFLNELSYNRVAEFNELLQEQRFYTNDIIYDQAAEASAFYIVKRGTVKVEAAVEIEH